MDYNSVMFKRPGKCFGCRTMTDLEKMFYFDRKIWVCPKCIPKIKLWEKQMKKEKLKSAKANLLRERNDI